LRCGGVLLSRQSFLARVEFRFTLREFLLLLRLSLGGEALFHLSVDLSFSFFFRLLLLAGNKTGQSKACAENVKLFHLVVRHRSSLVIRRKQLPGRINRSISAKPMEKKRAPRPSE